MIPLAALRRGSTPSLTTAVDSIAICQNFAFHWTTEVISNPNPTLEFPVHQEIITKAGIWNLENMQYDGLVEDEVYEFLFVFAPISFKGATGSPGRPIAMR